MAQAIVLFLLYFAEPEHSSKKAEDGKAVHTVGAGGGGGGSRSGGGHVGSVSAVEEPDTISSGSYSGWGLASWFTQTPKKDKSTATAAQEAAGVPVVELPEKVEGSELDALDPSMQEADLMHKKRMQQMDMSHREELKALNNRIQELENILKQREEKISALLVCVSELSLLRKKT
jgi:BMFP domain-containing protein YqiC